MQRNIDQILLTDHPGYYQFMKGDNHVALVIKIDL